MDVQPNRRGSRLRMESVAGAASKIRRLNCEWESLPAGRVETMADAATLNTAAHCGMRAWKERDSTKGSGPSESLVGGERTQSCSRTRTENDVAMAKGSRLIESFVGGERKQNFSRARTLNESGVDTNGHAGRVDSNCAGNVSVDGLRGSRSRSQNQCPLTTDTETVDSNN